MVSVVTRTPYLKHDPAAGVAHGQVNVVAAAAGGEVRIEARDVQLHPRVCIEHRQVEMDGDVCDALFRERDGRLGADLQTRTLSRTCRIDFRD
jgi:hypothetical protein